jgi:hypothetical protein
MLPLLLALAAAGGESKLPLAPGWAESSRLASRHATQAAAADGKFAFAVSNTHVARHDRATGRLLAAATAPGTRHLNSAFVWKGKVYCAHSNYPSKPEESDVRVYDPADDTLKVAHAFARSPGSLVWCVRDPGDKFWWCCFAHYGAGNARTLLAKMDDGFRELARWTFPAKVVDDWDGMSASGGLWDGETLLVSHHHFKVLYRLRLPKAGKELELVEALACPFPGQGIAADPGAKGGLVGIDRDRRAVVFASKK